jgi:hypothetical protein
MNMLSVPLTAEMVPSTITCEVFGDKYTKGGMPADGSLHLGDVLTSTWEDDLHFVQYHHRACMRLVKGVPHSGIAFGFCAFDLDFGGHKARPTLADFVNILRTAVVIDTAGEGGPNVVYATRGGCRWVYFIKPMDDEDLFERHRLALQKRLQGIMGEEHHGYSLDATPDWTRMFRAPWVTRDEVQEYEHPVRLIHDKLFDLRKLKVEPKPQYPKFTGNAPFGRDERLTKLTQDMAEEGQRNRCLFVACLHVLKKYNPAGQERWLDVLRNHSLAAGLDEREIESVIKSATNYLRRIA